MTFAGEGQGSEEPAAPFLRQVVLTTLVVLKFIFAFDRRGSLGFWILNFFFTFRVDLHANAYQHKTVKMFDLVKLVLL